MAVAGGTGEAGAREMDLSFKSLTGHRVKYDEFMTYVSCFGQNPTDESATHGHRRTPLQRSPSVFALNS